MRRVEVVDVPGGVKKGDPIIWRVEEQVGQESETCQAAHLHEGEKKEQHGESLEATLKRYAERRKFDAKELHSF